MNKDKKDQKNSNWWQKQQKPALPNQNPKNPALEKIPGKKSNDGSNWT